jgi:hypothetical protein
MAFTIPINKNNTSLYKMSENDQALITSCPPSLQQYVIKAIEKINVNIKSALLKYEGMKKDHIQELVMTYNYLLNAVKHAFEQKKDLEVDIPGTYENPSSEPSYEHWIRSNPIKAEAIASILSDLTTAGWDPKVKIDSYSIISGGVGFSGGKNVIITCKFEHK